MEQVTKYKIKCSGNCGKTTLRDSQYFDYLCKVCKNSLQEPDFTKYDDICDYCFAVERYESKTGKKFTGKSIEDFTKELSTIPEKYKDKVWRYCYMENHADGLYEVVSKFNDMSEIFKEDNKN